MVLVPPPDLYPESVKGSSAALQAILAKRSCRPPTFHLQISSRLLHSLLNAHMITPTLYGTLQLLYSISFVSALTARK